MALETNTDLNAYMEAFGTDATVSGVSMKVIFDNAYLNDLDVSLTQPMIHVPTQWLSGTSFGDSVVVGSFSGTVKEVQPDGTGISTVMLREV